ncbi:Glutamine synthetase 1 [Candidatus Bealeia paramacronuclearis]|uniref:Glutamine synthetase n=1 Tax=Candidatus Bealeia paramacronuclearis TaxID=1921001 RepID=A0ABZ2C5E8_9PROT|nr:Glutamine synthetase 1 [Candidatus Bealeia paramacronuclearis]
MSSSLKNTLSLIEDKNIEYVDFRFTDTLDVWHHVSFHASCVDEELLGKGVMFDGSSIPGWKGIEDSDMLMCPDLETAVMDPFTAHSTLNIICDVIEPTTGGAYRRDPRGVAKRAEKYIIDSGIADRAYFGPEPEFFIFDDVRYGVEMNKGFYYLDSSEGPYNSGRKEPNGNLANRTDVKGGYFPVGPVDQIHDMRAEMLSTMQAMGLEVEKHHHEVAPSQHELGFKYSTLTKTADHLQVYKYVIKNVAQIYGKTATFMPKPIYKDNGSGMHVHQSLWMKDKPLFMGDAYADLSEMALYYIGGIIRHGKALNAFTNPTTNSYKRLVPGYEAPVMLAYAARNRSAAIRVPFTPSKKAKRIEVRFPDPAANPYLAFAAMLMAGLDGIKNKIHPGDAHEANLYDERMSHGIPTVSASLREALESLDHSRDFLNAGGVFCNELIDGFIELKMQEAKALEMTPQPIEFKMYYGV